MKIEMISVLKVAGTKSLLSVWLLEHGKLKKIVMLH